MVPFLIINSFVIHIPIAFAALLAPFLNISPGNLLLLPIHVVLLELVIDPTCSIVLERQPAENNIMDRKPRSPKEKILTSGILLKSLMQGFIIFAASFGTYLIFLKNYPDNAPLSRTMGLAIIILSNFFLVQVNSSEYDFVFQSTLRLAKDKVMTIVSVSTIVGLLIILYTPLSGFLKLSPLSASQFALTVGIASAAVFWYEIVKFVKKIKFKSIDNECQELNRL